MSSTTSDCHVRNITVKNNVITGYSLKGDHNHGNTGIFIDNNTGSACSSPDSLHIVSNLVSGYKDGIYVNGGNHFSTRTANVDYNTIIMKSDSDGTTRYGIECIVGPEAVGQPVKRTDVNSISHNLIYGDTTAGINYKTPVPGFAGGSENVYGIDLKHISSAGSKTPVSCNYIHDLPVAFHFSDTNHLRWSNNIMERNQYGMVLESVALGYGSIDTQGSKCNPSDNIWLGDSSSAWPGWNAWAGDSIFATYTIGANPLPASILFVRPDAGVSPFYTPVHNGSRAGGTAYANGTSFFKDTTGCGSLPDPCSTCLQSYISCGGARMSHSNIIDIKNTIQTQQGYTVMPNPSNGNITIVQNIAMDDKMIVKVTDYTGKKVYDNTLRFANGSSNLKIEQAIPGLYILSLKDETGNVYTYKIVITK